MVCARCGNSDPEGAVYCSNCGAALTPQATSWRPAGGPAPEAVRAASAPPPENDYTTGQGDPYQQDYERAKAAGFPKPQPQPQGQNLGSQGFLPSLFDFRFNSFVTPQVVKVVYVLVMVLLALTELVFAITAFRINAVFGVISLFILCPVFFIVELALWRIVLEIFIVIFRIAEDIRAIRTRGDFRRDSAEAAGIGD